LDRYPSSATLKINLKASIPSIAAQKLPLNRKHEGLWEAIRKDSTLTPETGREDAEKLLKFFAVTSIKEPGQQALEGACTEFCVNGLLAGNCRIVWRYNEHEEICSP
jgi:hypothetical protein